MVHISSDHITSYYVCLLMQGYPNFLKKINGNLAFVIFLNIFLFFFLLTNCFSILALHIYIFFLFVLYIVHFFSDCSGYMHNFCVTTSPLSLLYEAVLVPSHYNFPIY